MDVEKLLEYLKDMNTKSFIFYTIIFTAVISNGFLGIYISDKELFLNLDTVKLLLLSLSVSLPHILLYSLIIFFILVIMKHQTITKFNESMIKYVIVLSCLFTTLSQISSIVVGFFVEFELEHYILTITIPVLFILMILYAIIRIKK